MSAVVPIVITLAVLIVITWIVSKGVFIVHQAEGIVIERFGKCLKVLQPGLNFVTPFIDTPRTFTWRKTFINSQGRIQDQITTNSRIDMRETVFNFLRQKVYTKDTIQLDVNSLMYFSIGDIKKAIYEVDDLQNAISNYAQTQLKEVFGNMTFADALASQTKINSHMKRHFAAEYAKWGIVVHRIELLDMNPSHETATAMRAQMIAERNRRGDFIRAEGSKAAMRLASEGTKMVKFNMGVAEQESLRKRSEGDAASIVELARAENTVLETMNAAMAGASQMEYMLAQRYMELIKGMMPRIENKTIYLPYDVSVMQGLITSLPATFGRKAPRLPGGQWPRPTREEASAAAEPAAEQFAELG